MVLAVLGLRVAEDLFVLRLDFSVDAANVVDDGLVDDDGNPIGVYDSRLTGSGSADPAARFAAVVLSGHPAYEVMGLFRRAALQGSLLLQG